MKLLLCLAVAVAVVHGDQKGVIDYSTSLKHNFLPATDSVFENNGKHNKVHSHDHRDQNIVENIMFLNEVEECRNQYPNLERKKFLTTIYCNIKNKQFTMEKGNICNLTESLVRKIRLEDFIIFKRMPTDCGGNFSGKRNAGNSEVVNGGKGKSKRSDLSYIYLGVSRYPMYTPPLRRFYRNADEEEDKMTVFLERMKKSASYSPSTAPKKIFNFIKYWKIKPISLVEEAKNTNVTVKTTPKPITESKPKSTPSPKRNESVIYAKLSEIFYDLIAQFSKLLDFQDSKSKNGKPQEKKEGNNEKDKNADGKKDEKKKPIKRSVEKQNCTRSPEDYYVTVTWESRDKFQ